MPAFSRAISARVLPRISVCSSPMLVTTAISPATTLVEFEPPAKTNLDHRPFDARLAKDDERRRGQKIEPGRLGRRGALSARGLVGVERLRQRAPERRLVDVAALKAHPLGHVLDMRRAVAADP